MRRPRLLLWGMALVVLVGIAGVLRRCASEWARTSNEAHAIAVLREMSYRQEQYRRSHGHGLYADRFELLRQIPTDEAEIPFGTSHGYTFRLVTATAEIWAATAVPVSATESGNRAFYNDERGMIRWGPASAGEPDRTSLPIGQDLPKRGQ